jgi:hypothetical protein
MTGKVGADLTTEQGAEAAKFVALNILATLKGESFGPSFLLEMSTGFAPLKGAAFFRARLLSVRR